MSETKVTLTVEQQNGAEDALNTSNTVIQTDSLEQLMRMLKLAGVGRMGGQIVVPSEEVPTTELPTELPTLSMTPPDSMGGMEFGGDMGESTEGEPYTGLSSKPGSRPDLRVTNNSGDNALEEDDSDERKVADTYHLHRDYHDHDESVARTADEHGVSGEQVVRAVSGHRAYESVEEEVDLLDDTPRMESARSFKDYLKEFQEFKATHADDMDEAYGSFGGRNQRMQKAFADPDSVALLPIPGLMLNLDGLGDNDYFGDDLVQGKSSIVVWALKNPDGTTRITYASTYGTPSEKPGQNYLTYHDQNPSKTREGTVLATFSGADWADPKKRGAIAQQLAAAGVNPKKKYSIRVYK